MEIHPKIISRAQSAIVRAQQDGLEQVPSSDLDVLQRCIKRADSAKQWLSQPLKELIAGSEFQSEFTAFFRPLVLKGEFCTDVYRYLAEINPRAHRGWKNRIFDLRFDVECWGDVLIQAAEHFGIERPMCISGIESIRLAAEGELHPSVEYQRLTDDLEIGVRQSKSAWHSAAQSRKELPRRWEISSWPFPVRGVSELREHLSAFLGLVSEVRPEGYDQSLLDDLKRELRNARVALFEWEIPFEVNDEPKTVHEAEKALESVIRFLSERAAESPLELSDTTAGLSDDCSGESKVKPSNQDDIIETRFIAELLKSPRAKPGELLPNVDTRIRDFVFRVPHPFIESLSEREYLTKPGTALLNGEEVTIPVADGIRGTAASDLATAIIHHLTSTQWHRLPDYRDWSPFQAEAAIRKAAEELPKLCDRLEKLLSEDRQGEESPDQDGIPHDITYELFTLNGGLPKPICEQLLQWWLNWDGGRDWHRIEKIPQQHPQHRLNQDQFVEGFTRYLAPRGLVKCRSHVRLRTPNRELVEMVFDWGGSGQSLKEAAIEVLKEDSLWQSDWPEDGDGLFFDDGTKNRDAIGSFAVHDSYKTFPLKMPIINEEITKAEKLNKLHQSFPNWGPWKTRLHYCSIGREPLVGTKKPREYWLKDGRYGEPVRYPFGDAPPAEQKTVEEVETPPAAPNGKTSDPNRKERNRITFWATIRDAHFDEQGKCTTDSPLLNKELTNRGMTGNPSEMFRLHLTDLADGRLDWAKPRELYEWFCKDLLRADPDRVYAYIAAQLNDKSKGWREKQASSQTLDSKDEAWRERQAETDREIDSRTD